ncbi:hypothetical protein W822_05710 [Advenella kashmirensis W13003]|uniref:Uncharacterized protein n=1 Tax=Advenella kashmirensis W13003 TaxID=1424334 RepID=V8QUL9_9BURK|nr:hypothetical protein W822_05710 [Advenella kashmirensis W13003]
MKFLSEKSVYLRDGLLSLFVGIYLLFLKVNVHFQKKN